MRKSHQKSNLKTSAERACAWNAAAVRFNAERKLTNKPYILLLPLALALIMITCLQLRQRLPAKQPDAAFESAVEAAGNGSNRPQPASAKPPPMDTHGSVLAQLAPHTQRLISQLLDDSLPLKTRRQAARALAKLGSDEALTALKDALPNCQPYVKAAAGEGLGQNPSPAAEDLLADLANGRDEIAARGAIRGLGQRGDAQAIDLLGSILFDPHRPSSVRTEAALALGDAEQPGALALLTRAASEFQEANLADHILLGLGKRPFAETGAFFGDYLESSSIPVEAKVLALEALSGSQGEVAPFLLKYAADQCPEIRAAAAWSLSALDSPGDLGQQLLDLLQHESDPGVRRRLYQALGNQESCDWATVVALAKSESAPGPRLAGFDLLAQACSSGSAPEAMDFFHQTALPELQAIALNSQSAEDRLSAAMILRRAGVAQSAGALQEIARLSDDASVVAAARAALQVAR